METLDCVTELSLLYEISAIPTSFKDFDQIGEVVTDKAVHLLSNDVAIFYLYNTETGTLQPRASQGITLEQVGELSVAALGKAIITAITAKRPWVWQKGDEDEAPKVLATRYKTKAAIFVPVQNENELLGLIYAGRLKDYPFPNRNKPCLMF